MAFTVKNATKSANAKDRRAVTRYLELVNVVEVSGEKSANTGVRGSRTERTVRNGVCRGAMKRDRLVVTQKLENACVKKVSLGTSVGRSVKRVHVVENLTKLSFL